jgi:Ribbon-helix-helix protein, copG family
MPRPRAERRAIRLSVSLAPQAYAQLRALAQRTDVSTAWMVRRAITELLERTSQPGETLELPLPRRSAPPRLER